MAPEPVSVEDGFVAASSSSDWYKNLERYGSCLRLLQLLQQQPEMIHQVGPEGITVLHKGVQHGCVKLVRFILVDMFDGDGNCACSRRGADNPQGDLGTSSGGESAKAIGKKVLEESPKSPCDLTREGLVRKTCEYGSTAVNMAVVSGSPKMVLLLKWAIDKFSPKNWSKMAEKRLSDIFTYRYGHYKEMRSRFKREQGDPREEKATDITNIDTEVPDVTDDAIDKIYENDHRSTLIRKVYSLVEGILNEDWGTDKEEMDMLKDGCRKHADFEFVTKLPHVFLHFLLCISYRDIETSLPGKILRRVLEACNSCDLKDGSKTGSMVVTLFNILDPRGRTILHAACENSLWGNETQEFIHFHLEATLETRTDGTDHPEQVARECVNAKDGAGRTILHLACVHLYSGDFQFRHCSLEKQNWDEKVAPLCHEELKALKKWCFPLYHEAEAPDDYTPFHLAVIFDSMGVLDGLREYVNDEEYYGYLNTSYRPSYFPPGNRIWAAFQIAAFLGRSKIIENILKMKGIPEVNCVEDIGFGNFGDDPKMPAIHCAALSGQVEAIQCILKYPIYDPFIQDHDYRIYRHCYYSNRAGTALHLLLKRESFKKELETFHILAQLHALPNSESYRRVKNDFLKLQIDDSVPRMFSANEISCINLLLQAGIDIWTPNKHTGERPSPGPMANDEARKWWYDKVVTEVMTQKTSVSSAANATSVVAALVATASFIGPFQPPLSYSSDGYVHTSVSAVRVYLVCNSLSFFFSIASILMALLPAIPMPKESLYDELFRSQRCLKVAALMLLISIVCLLVGFSSASIAVVSSERHDKQVVATCVALGWVICTIVLGIYIIRMLRMFLHRNDRFRRWFAKRMVF